VDRTPHKPASGSEHQYTTSVKGWAYSGGGRGIVRVDVSADNGLTWHTAELLEGADQHPFRAWAWTFWEAEVPVPLQKKAFKICCKAVDTGYNVQPERPQPIWNARGLNNNSWHRVQVAVDVVNPSASGDSA